MQSVPAEWISLHSKTILPISDLIITFDIEDLDAKDKVSSISMTGGNAISVSSEIINSHNMFNNAYVLDKSGFILDGGGSLYNSNFNNIGYISTTPTNNDGTLSVTNSIVINFSSVITTSLPYLTIQWNKANNQYAQGFTIKLYNGGTLLNTITITNNTSVMSLTPINVANYDKIEITITKWSLGGVVPKIEQVVLGQRLIIDRTILTKYTDTREIDLNSLTLPLNGIKFEIDNSDDKFNPDNPSGIYSYLQERQEVNVFFGLKLSNGMYYINGGVFYITEWKVPQNSITATFTASHLLDFMKKDFDISQLGTLPITCSLADIITSAFTQCGINAADYVIDNSLTNISVTIDTEIGYKCNEMVQMAANAGECIIRVDRNGKINIETFDINSLTDSGYVIDRFVAYKNADYDNTASLKEVIVNDGLGSYSTGNTKGEAQTLQNPLIQTQARANSVAQWVSSVLSNNKQLTGDWRADTRLDIIDLIKVYNKYATAIPMVVTSINYTFNGLFRGTYEGRII